MRVATRLAIGVGGVEDFDGVGRRLHLFRRRGLARDIGQCLVEHQWRRPCFIQESRPQAIAIGSDGEQQMERIDTCVTALNRGLMCGCQGFTGLFGK